jgi:hypothetical protein
VLQRINQSAEGRETGRPAEAFSAWYENAMESFNGVNRALIPLSCQELEEKITPHLMSIALDRSSINIRKCDCWSSITEDASYYL